MLLASVISREELYSLYHQQKKSDYEIAESFGVWHSQISKLRKEYAIPTIPQWARHTCLPTEEQLQVIYGMLLGDSSLTSGYKNGVKYNSSLTCMHCIKQRDYVWWKYHKLDNLCNSEPKPTRKNAWWFETFKHPFFTELRDELYPNGRKSVSEVFLKKIISPLAVAVWFMDDGNNNHGRYFKIATCAFDKQEHEMLRDWMYSAYRISMEVKPCGRYLTLDVSKGSRLDFINMISDYVEVNCMRYKLALGDNYERA